MDSRHKIKNSSILGIIILFILLGIYFIAKFPQNYDKNITHGYMWLLISYYLIGGSFICFMYIFKFDLFDLIVIFFVFDFFCLVIAPISFIILDKTDAHGVYIMDGCVRGTIIHIISYFGIMLGWITTRIKCTDKKNKLQNNINMNTRYVVVTVILWIIFFSISLIYHFKSGKSMLYVLTLGIAGNGIDDSVFSNSSLKFLINVSYSLIPLWLLIMYFSKNTLLKIITGFLSFCIYMIGGHRFIIVVMAVALILSFYLKEDKRPSKKLIIIALIGFIIFSVILGYVRGGIRSGNGFNLSGISFESFLEVLESNFDIYKTYYGVVADIPKNYLHTYGTAIFLDPFIYVIPRAIWHSKPAVENMTLLETMINCVGSNVIIGNGMSTVWLTEIYIDFGYIGAFTIPFIVGQLMKKIKEVCCYRRKSIFSIFIYSIIYGTIMQIVTRGYTAMNVWMLFFLIYPIPLVLLLSKKIKK